MGAGTTVGSEVTTVTTATSRPISKRFRSAKPRIPEKSVSVTGTNAEKNKPTPQRRTGGGHKPFHI